MSLIVAYQYRNFKIWARRMMLEVTPEIETRVKLRLDSAERTSARAPNCFIAGSVLKAPISIALSLVLEAKWVPPEEAFAASLVHGVIVAGIARGEFKLSELSYSARGLQLVDDYAAYPDIQPLLLNHFDLCESIMAAALTIREMEVTQRTLAEIIIN